MTIAVDTNVLLALLYEGEYTDDSESALRRAYKAGLVVITPTVYAELAADCQFSTRGDLDQFLTDLSIKAIEPSTDALFFAGQQFARYMERRPTGLQCPSCGTTQRIRCGSCSADLAPRQHIAADFIIGGHAATDADGLVSFDTGFYSTYFPSVTIYPT